jgi:glycosyltransferase involved in cell wall biosynthesis
VRILGSNSTFFYDLLPFLNKKVLKVELLHNFSYDKNGMEFFGLANHQYLDKRMVIDAFTRLNIINQYREYGVDESYDERVILMEYGVHIPQKISKEKLPPLKVLYAGRGTPQKRIWLLNRIAEHFIGKSNVQFLFVGTMADELSAAVKKNYRVYNETGDRSEMDKLFVEAHAIILTSSFEGFPVVVKEGMACGCVPIVTALPGNKTHLTHMLNALLIENFNDEDKVVETAIEHITTLSSKHDLLEQLSSNAYEYALKRFGKQTFQSVYRNMLS